MIAALLTMMACGEGPAPPPPGMRLMMRPILALNTGVAGPGGPEKAVAFLHPEQLGPCQKFEPTFTLDGVPMTRLHGKVTGQFRYDRDCNVYEYALEPATGVGGGPTSTLVVTDGVDTARMVVDNLFAPRTLAPEKATAKPGEEVVLRWSPATDVYDGKGVLGVTLTREGEEPVAVRGADVRFADGAVRFTLPADIAPGPLGVEFQGTAFVQPHVAACEWVVRCDLTRTYTVAPASITVEK